MMNQHPVYYDIVIAGAGFAGSVTALALRNSGFKVGVIEKGKHPRFAIGESSTPIADMILRSLSVQYDLPWLYDFSRYGSWQQAHPEIVCGIKRGFSYFKHHPGQPFTTDSFHSNELLVAASINDTLSDTNWLRADFDAFLVSQVQAAGIDYFDCTEIISATRENRQWTFNVKRQESSMLVYASFFIDATGSGALADRLFKVSSSAAGFLTNSFALFSHFDGLPRWTTMLEQRGISTTDFPYDPDNSALHHVLDEGWIWALRFNNGRTSWGFTLNGNDTSLTAMNKSALWNKMRSAYPDIDFILKQGTIAPQPGAIIQSGRLQRKLEKCYGEGWLALPHTIGFVDPLFSSGIAWSLAGIERVLKILNQNKNFDGSLYERLAEYEQISFEELRLVDLLIAGCYQTMRHFAVFNAWSMLYFTFTVLYEQRRLKNEPVKYFLDAGNPEVQKLIHTSYQELRVLLAQKQITSADADAFRDRIRERIKPFNTAGLLDPLSKNMYCHTLAAL